jgi:hypothetical protein
VRGRCGYLLCHPLCHPAPPRDRRAWASRSSWQPPSRCAPAHALPTTEACTFVALSVGQASSLPRASQHRREGQASPKPPPRCAIPPGRPVLSARRQDARRFRRCTGVQRMDPRVFSGIARAFPGVEGGRGVGYFRSGFEERGRTPRAARLAKGPVSLRIARSRVRRIP